ncbi:MAG: cytochrome c3 family protein [Planctomycetota bacterium]|jgi:hypothetical protein
MRAVNAKLEIRNPKPIGVLLLGAALLSLASCPQNPSVTFTPVGGTGRPDPLSSPGAFDIIKMSRFSDEAGPVYFAHALHADLTDIQGNPIPCVRCHHDLRSPEIPVPMGCATCHLPHDHSEKDGPRPT